MRGLILPGGGAKGAFQFGCLEAFAAAGEDPDTAFDIVCGTSVGALNGTLWGLAALEEGASIWAELSFANVFPPKNPYRGPFASTYHRVRGALHVAWSLVIHRIRQGQFRGSDLGYTKAVIWVLAVLTALPPFAALIAATLMFPDSRALRWAGPSRRVLFIVGAGVDMVLLFRWLQGRMFTATSVEMMGTRNMVLKTMERSLTWPLSIKVVSAFFTPGDNPVVVWAALGIMVLGHVPIQNLNRDLRRTLKGDAPTYLTKAPLEATIEKIVQGRTPRCRTFCTVAEPSEVMGLEIAAMFEEMLVRLPPGQTEADAAARAQARTFAATANTADIPREFHIARYTELTAENAKTWGDVVVASASLPFGIVESEKLGDRDCVDGGVADNIPFYPAIALGADDLTVIYLDRFPDRHAAFERALGDINRAFQIFLTRGIAMVTRALREEMTPEPGQVGLDALDPAFVQRMTDGCTFRLRVIYPERHLGGFLNGVLNFDQKYASELRILGQAEATRHLAGATFQMVHMKGFKAAFEPFVQPPA
jgi:predicted acylesterase/phospholipase RssA